jgi:hypothetical protein
VCVHVAPEPYRLLDALDGQRKDRFHHRSTAIHEEQLTSDETRLVSAEENHSVTYIGWEAEAPHGRPAALVPVLNLWNTWGGSPLRTLSSQAPGLMIFTVMPFWARATAK